MTAIVQLRGRNLGVALVGQLSEKKESLDADLVNLPILLMDDFKSVSVVDHH